MLKRVLLAWLIANFLLVGTVSWFTGGWYLGWDLLPVTLAELGLIMLPNIALPILLVKYFWPESVRCIQVALGWTWQGWRTFITGIISFLLALGWSNVVSIEVGDSIPYCLPGSQASTGSIEDPVQLLESLLFLVTLVGITVAGEETMFRGLIQTQLGTAYGAGRGLCLGIVLFGLRHLPADLFYAQAWDATPLMWLARQLDLYGFALILGLARRYGRSTFAPAIGHTLVYFVNIFG
jgi:membrane protease YdiL (CAAX protease family)